MVEHDSSTGRGLSRRSMLVAGVGVPAAAGLVGATGTAAAAPKPPGETRRITMYAEEIGGGLMGYGLTSASASIPGPVLEMWEGDTLEIELVNNTSERLSIHPHGVDYDVHSDGSPLNASFNEPGQTRTYVWKSHAQPNRGGGLPGSAGYWHYHDHANGTPHGSLGIARGLYGALVVRRRGDLLPDRQYTLVFNEMSVNNKVAPEAPIVEARLGERVEFIAIGHGNQFHTFHMHGHRWVNNRTGYVEGPHDHSPVVDTRDLNPGDSFGFQVIAGERVGPGAWMYHCHVQVHSDDGMAGIFLVRNADGSLPQHAQDALERYRAHESNS